MTEYINRYTMADLKRGRGFYVGEWTMIYRIGRNDYMTCEKSEVPRNPDAEFVGGGYLGADGKPRINWC